MRKSVINGKSELSYNLTLGIIDENFKQVQFNLNNKEYILDKRTWLNTMKVFDDGKTFFIMCSKQINTDYAFDVLMKYALKKIDQRVERLLNEKEILKQEIKGCIAA